MIAFTLVLSACLPLLTESFAQAHFLTFRSRCAQNLRTTQANPGNSTIAFADNSSALRGSVFDALRPAAAAAPSPYVAERADYGTLSL